jgi:glycosyltransferase involved in cell wall biosynthesis
MNRPLSISIVTPSFNQASFLGEALVSVRKQSYEHLEHLVIDGASTDGTVGMLREYSARPNWRHLRWTSAPDRGQSDALNQGFGRASGDIVGWLNSDDRYLPGCFDQVSCMFEQNPEIDILYGDYRWIDESGNAYRIRREIEFSRFVLLYHRVLYIPTTATFFRRRVFEEGNFLDESLHYALDFEFFVRLARHGYRFRHLPAVLADFRFQPHSKTCVSPYRQLEEKRRIMEEYSPFLRRLRWPGARRGGSALLGFTAAALRYSEKLLRGYYFKDRRIPPISA